MRNAATLLLCAWVIWGLSANVWLPLGGYDTRAECYADRESRQARVEKGHLVCLPDTVDPREPKR
jgi:hypothetical protein